MPDSRTRVIFLKAQIINCHHTSVFGSMFLYQIFRNCQCLKDVQVWTYDLGTVIKKSCTSINWPPPMILVLQAGGSCLSIIIYQGNSYSFDYFCVFSMNCCIYCVSFAFEGRTRDLIKLFPGHC